MDKENHTNRYIYGENEILLILTIRMDPKGMMLNEMSNTEWINSMQFHLYVESEKLDK